MRPTLKSCALLSFIASAGTLMIYGDFGLAAAQDDLRATGATGGSLLALRNAPDATIAASQTAVASASPRYVYRPGPSGMGYYQLAGPTAAAPAAPARQASTGRSGGRVRDWTTGHSLPSGGLMNKPWLRPR